MCGIYKITNKINQKCYIGQSIDIKRRWRSHKNDAAKIDYPLYLAFHKYGIENFSFEVIEECDRDKLNEREIYWIEYYNSYYQGYNQTLGGNAFSHIVKISDEDLFIILDLLKNTNVTQKQIAENFGVGEDTISEINNGKTRVVKGYDYPVRAFKKEYLCLDCGKRISHTSLRCEECAKKKVRKVERPSREELKVFIRTYPFTKLSEKFGVSDNAIRKWCKTYGLPSSSREIKKISEEDWNKI